MAGVHNNSNQSSHHQQHQPRQSHHHPNHNPYRNGHSNRNGNGNDFNDYQQQQSPAVHPIQTPAQQPVPLPVDIFEPSQMNGGGLIDFFTCPVKQLPIIQQTQTRPIFGMSQFSDFQDGPIRRGERDYVNLTEDDEFLYVQEYRQEEFKKIQLVNDESSNHGRPPEPIREPRRPIMPRHNASRGRAGAGRGRGASYGDPSIVGPMDPHGDRITMEAPADLYARYDMSKRNADHTQLAIYTAKDRVLSAITTHQVTVIEGFTGCGKTTQVPQYILDEAAEKGRFCKIVVTQPRRIAALSVANRVCFERNWELGSLVGYQVGMDRKFSDDSRLVYMTTGVLLQMMINKKNLNEWSHIIIDEVHERDLDTDLLLLVIKKIMIEMADTYTKVILMSATLSVEKFSDYFPGWICQGIANGATAIKIPPVFQYPVTEHYINNISGIAMPMTYQVDFYDEPKIAPDIYDMAVNIIRSFDIFERNENLDKRPELGVEGGMLDAMQASGGETLPDYRGAVLVFLPGLLEIETMYKCLSEVVVGRVKNQDGVDDTKWTLLPLHSSITNDEQQKAFQPAAKGYRKIILATNIAESSITVADIKYVIDFCLTKSLNCDPTTNYTCLRMEWASKNQCIQRKGRCGRVSPGHVYRMVPQLFYDGLVQEASPEMEKSSLESVVLHAKMLNMGSPKALLALAVDPPKLSGIRRAVANLKEVGALTIECMGDHPMQYNEFDGDLTYLGQVMAKLPIDMRFGRLIMMGYIFGLLDETIIIAAGMSTKSPFSYPYHRRLQAYMSKLYWSQNTFSDCFALINVYRTWTRKFEGLDFRRRDDEKMWAKQYLVQLNVMREIKNLVDEIKRRLATMGIGTENQPTGADITETRAILLKIVIAGAFYPNYFWRNRPKKTEYERDITKELIGRDPTTTVVYQGFPSDQPGELYAMHIFRHFECESLWEFQPTMPFMDFQGSKILLSFDNRGHKIGPLCHGIYRAVKMRQLRQMISFKVMRRNHSIDAVELALQKLSLNPDVLNPAPRQITLPSILDRNFKVGMVHVKDPSEFYVIRECDWDAYEELMKEITRHRDKFTSLRWDELHKGDLVIVLHNSQYYRGRIDLLLSETNKKGEIFSRSAYVFLIDCGVLVLKKSQELQSLSRKHCSLCYELGGLAIQCRVREIKAPIRSGGVYSDKVADEIFEYFVTYDEFVDFQLFSIVESVMAGDITTRMNTGSLRDYLLKYKIADDSPESRESGENYNMRCSTYVARQDKAVQAQFSDKQMTNKIPKPSLTPPLEDEDWAQVTLRGPNSPLEMSFNALCRSSHLKQVVVDGASVNSVALDQDYLTPSSRLLIAANIGIAHRSGNLMARETTMLPAIPGLNGLLILLFCPTVELRLNDSCTEYTGALSGLGVNPLTKEPIYGDHDVEVMFDTVIDNDDLNKINSIRMTMNYILREKTSRFHHLREKACQEVLELLGKERAPIEETWPMNLHQWGDVREDLPRLSPGAPQNGLERQENDVFRLHTGYILP